MKTNYISRAASALLFAVFVSVAPAAVQTCDLYPIAVPALQLSNAVPGDVIGNIVNGTQPGSFGWLTWAGSPSEPTLVKSLTRPGDSVTYVNPDNTVDHQISLGDWIQAKPGVSNGRQIRDALDALKNVEITVPVWDQARGSGANAAYRVSGFARIRVLSYQLPGQNRITAEFLGTASCGVINVAPLVDAGPDLTNSVHTLPATVTLNALVSDDGLPQGSSVALQWSLVAGPGGVTFDNAASVSTAATFTNEGIYLLQLSASDSDLSGTDTVVVTINRANQPPVAFSTNIIALEDVPMLISLPATDPDGDALNYSISSNPLRGLLELTGTNGVFRYVPCPDCTDPDEFSFRVDDGFLQSSNARVIITIVGMNDQPVADSFAVTNSEDTTVTILLSGADVEGSSFAFQVPSQPTNGTLTATSSNVVFYTPSSNFFGQDSFTYVVNDGETNSESATVLLVIEPVNDVPLVDAGPDQLITIPSNSVTLAGQVLDDVFDGSWLTVQWSKISGPGTVSFADNGTNVATVATFETNGVYTLRLTADDGFLWAYDEVIISVNGRPFVSAGTNQLVNRPADILLFGAANDDNFPVGNELTVTWTAEGPGTVTFLDSASAATTASVSASGIYTFHLIADDGAARSTNSITVLANDRPLVDAGASRTISNLVTTLTGSVIDDAFPSNTLSLAWTKVSGPGEVTFASPGQTNTAVTFSASGTYVLRLTADDGAVQAISDVTVRINLPPTVSAGLDFAVVVGVTTNLSGEVHDDGYPEGSSLTVFWDFVSGPGTVILPDKSSSNSQVRFTGPGTYVLRLTANDSEFSGSDEVTVIVEPSNEPPFVTAGQNQIVTLPDTAALRGLALDDGLPVNGSLTVHWSKITGPGDVTFGSPDQTNTTATFSAPGTYVLRMTASDAALSSVGDVTLLVRTEAMNTAPAISAGADKVVGLTNVLTLTGVVTDDGLPRGSSVTSMWSQVSGPGVATFENPGSPCSRVRFDTLGTYILRLSAGDTALTAVDDVQVTVYPFNQPPIVNAGSDQDIVVPDPAIFTPSGRTPTNATTDLALSMFSSPTWSTNVGVPGLYSGIFNGGTLRNSLAVDGTNLYAAGYFNYAGTNLVRFVARWDGQSWFPLYDPRPSNTNNPSSPPIGFAARGSSEGFDAVVTWRGEVYIRGNIQDLDRNGFTDDAARWTGTGWEAWQLPPNTNHSLSGAGCLATSPTAIYLGMEGYQFTITNAVDGKPIASQGIAKWNGTNWLAFGSGIAGRVVAITETPNGDVYAAGRFILPTPSGMASNIARWDGTKWNPVGNGVTLIDGSVPDRFVSALYADEVGNVYAAGRFDRAGIVPARNVAMWNGTEWSPLGVGPQNGVDSAVNAIVTYGRDIYFAGQFKTAGTAPATNAVRWNGQFWSSLGYGRSNGTFGTIYSLAAAETGIYVSGTLTHAGGKPVNNIAFWEFPPGSIQRVRLLGQITDDGLPADGQLSASWTKVSGPGEVTFSNPFSASTAATFSHLGTYVLRLTGTDSDFSVSDEVTIIVRGNEPPVVQVGPDQVIDLSATTIVHGSITDDGFPPNAEISSAWSVAYGAGNVTFGNISSTNTTVSFSAAGTYAFRLVANDSQFSSYDELIVTVRSINNRAPYGVARANPESLPVGQLTTLNAADLQDDGLPYGVTNILWTQVSGPDPLRFFNPELTSCQAMAVAVGKYTVRVNINDGERTYFNDYSFTATAGTAPAPDGNLVPIVQAGSDLTGVAFQPTTLHGSVSDDGVPGTGVKAVWSKVSGPAEVYFSDAASLVTTAKFYVPGTYELRLYATDGRLSAWDDVKVTIVAPTNEAPVVVAGSDLEIIRPSPAQLHAYLLDDALPAGYPKTFTWSKDSGPGEVTFTPASGNIAGDYLSAMAAFSSTGTYVLRVTVSDSVLSDTDTLTVTVLPGTNSPPVVDAGSDQIVALPNAATLHTDVQDDGLEEGLLQVVWSQVSGPGAVYFNSLNGQYRAEFSAPGEYVLRLTADDGTLSSSDDVVITVYEAPDAPIAVIASPVDSAPITFPSNIAGTVSSPILSSYVLQYRLAAGEDDLNPYPWITFAAGTAPVANGTLGQFDPTLLLNGTYELQLIAGDLAGRISTTNIFVVVDRNMKVGHFTVSFNDLTIPVAGIPMQVIRTYDSRDKRVGDFGVGWNLDLNNIRLQKNRNLGLNWEQSGSSQGLGNYSLTSRRPRTVTITFPDGKTQKFRAQSQPESQISYPITGPTIVYVPEANTRGTLVSEQVGGDEVFTEGTIGTANLFNYDGSTYNPSLFRYTTDEGDVYIIDERDGLKSLTDRNGNRLVVETNGITWTNVVTGGPDKSITFHRDELGRITNILDAAGYAMTYGYDTNGNLVEFVDRVNLTNSFSYSAKHELLTLVDARGITAARNEYDAAGRLIAQVDAAGNTNTFIHDLSNRAEIVRDRLGHVTVNEYDENGNITRTIDALNNVTTMTYDANDNLLTKVDALGNTNRYTYDSRDNKLTETDPLGNTVTYTYDAFDSITSIRDARGFVTTNIYDAQGNLRRTIDPLQNVTEFAYDGQGNITRKTDALGNTVDTSYDAFGNITNVVVTDAQRGVLSITAFTYDANGNRHTQTALRPTTPEASANAFASLTAVSVPEISSLQWTYEVNAEGRTEAVVAPDGNRIAITFDGLGKPASVTDGLNRTRFYDYDVRGNLFRVRFPDSTSEMFGFDADNRLVSYQDRAGRFTFLTNDALGRVVSTRLPDGNTRHTTYDAVGRVTSKTDERGFTTRLEYDPNCGCSGRNTKIIDPLTNITSYAYDENGNVKSMTDASGRTTTYVYDELDRLTITLYADGNASTNFYDGENRQVVAVDEEGNATWFGYDGLDRLVAVTNALGHVTTFGFDPFGNLESQTDAESRTTRYRYDSLNRRTHRILPGLQTEVYGYDAVDNVTNVVHFDGRITTYAYDALNRLVQKKADPALAEPAVSFTYTSTGLRQTMTDGAGTTTYGYNARDWLTNKTTPQGTLVYERDPVGNVTRIASMNAGGVNVGYEYDALNRLVAVNDPAAGRTTFGFNSIGNVSSYHYANGLRTTNQFDLVHWLTNVATHSAQAALLQQYEYTRNKAGKRTQVTEPGRRTVIYGHDALYRLTSETVVGANNATLNVNYTYDKVGNRKTRGSESYNYDDNDLLLGPLYDDNGNTTNAVLFDPFVGLATPVSDQYDSENHLTVRSPGFAGNHVEIAYDGDGNRVRKTLITPTNSITTWFLVDDQNPTGYAQVMEELTAVNAGPAAVTRVYTYDYALLSQHQYVNGQWYLSFYGYDDQGNVRYLTDANGDITDTYDYDAFGNLIQQSGDTPNTYLFAGEQYDWDLGLYYLRARYMNPETGRFWTRDPFEGFADEPLSLNPYLYGNADPVNNSDPSGYFSLADVSAASHIQASLRFVRPAIRFVKAARKIKWCKALNAMNKAMNAMDQVQQARALAVGVGSAATAAGTGGVGALAEIAADMYGDMLIEAYDLKGLEQYDLFTQQANFEAGEEIYTRSRSQSGAGETPCFVAGTLVHTEHGLRPIETLKVGDKVWALGQGTFDKALKPITHILSNQLAATVFLELADETIETTYEHPFWVRNEGWVSAGKLQGGDYILAESGDWFPILKTQFGTRHAAVFNLEVEDFHTYFVGCNPVLVHNAVKLCGCEGYTVGPYGSVGGHHIIQNASVLGLPRYSENAAPAVQLGGNHVLTYGQQHRPGGGTYAHERRVAYRALRAANVPKDCTRALIWHADEYFAGIGIGPGSRTNPVRGRRGAWR